MVLHQAVANQSPLGLCINRRGVAYSHVPLIEDFHFYTNILKHNWVSHCVTRMNRIEIHVVCTVT